MKIQNMSLKNFRSIAQLNFNDLHNLNCFIGPHNAGKSNILDAVSVFWDSKYRAFAQARAEKYFIPVKNDFDSILPFLGNLNVISGNFYFKLGNRVDTWLENEFIKENFRQQAIVYKYPTPKSILSDLVDETTEIMQTKNLSGFIFEITLRKDNLTLIKEKVSLKTKKGEVVNFESKKIPLEIIHEAFAKSFVKRFNDGLDSQKELQSDLLRLLRGKDYKTLDRIEEFLRDVLSQNFRFELGVRIPNVGQTIDVTVENAFTSPFWRISASTKRIISLAYLLSCTPIDQIIIIDEPSLYLHPKGERALARRLEKLSRKHQLFVSTHSSRLLIGYAYLVDLYKGWTRIRPIRGEKTMKKVVRILGIRPSDSFGSDVVVFVEGRTDERVYRVFEDIIIGDHIRASRNRVRYIGVGGWTNMKFILSIELLKSKFVRSKAIAITDGDIVNSETYERVRTNWNSVFPKNTFFSLHEECIESLFLNNSDVFIRTFSSSIVNSDQLQEFIARRRNRGISDKIITIELLQTFFGKRYRSSLAETLAKKFKREEIPLYLRDFFFSQILQ
ncbi:MAG: ATP-dependent nuclease [Candidatus Hodarchaeales archaeon]